MAVFISGGGFALPSFLDVFSENTWEQIIVACQLNRVPDTWKIGDQKAMTINGAAYMVTIIGKNHDSYSDGTGNAPLTFQLRECYNTTYRMNGSNTNNGGWTNSQMRSTHLPTVLNLMPSVVQSSIREVNKLTTDGKTSSTIVTTADKLFLLSEIEVFGLVSISKSGEGTQYEYYKKGNSSIKQVNGTNNSYWLRSPQGTTSTNYCCVNVSGGTSFDNASNPNGVPFAFCF